MTDPLPSPVAPRLLTVAGLAKAARIHRSSVLRLVAQKRIEADAFVIEGAVCQPLFAETRAAQIERVPHIPAAQTAA